MLAAGHTPAPVVEAIKEQLEALIHMCAIVSTTESYVELCELLNRITPGSFKCQGRMEKWSTWISRAWPWRAMIT